jgi:hypothetical protein
LYTLKDAIAEVQVTTYGVGEYYGVTGHIRCDALCRNVYSATVHEEVEPRR